MEEPLQAFGLAALQSLVIDHEENTKECTRLSGIGLAQSAQMTHVGNPKIQEFGGMLLDTLQPWRTKRKKQPVS